MNLSEKLKAKQDELVALKAKIAEGDEEAITKGGEIADEIEALETKIKAADKANAMLKNIGSKEEKNDEPEVKTGLKSLQAQAKSVDRSKKGWSIGASLKAATDVVTTPQATPFIEYDRSVEMSETRSSRIADLFPQARISGNAVTYFVEGPAEGEADAVNEGGKKPQVSTKFTPKTAPLTKIAAYIKETDEVIDDADFLASAVEEVVTRKLVKTENDTVISALTTDAPVVEYEADTDANKTTQNMMEAILKAKSEIEQTTDYVADIILMTPAAYFAMQTAKDSNGQYFGGGWASGAYGNGSYSSAVTPWGMRVIVSNELAGLGNGLYVLASGAAKIYRKSDIDVRVYEQNEDDALYNRVTVLAEERLVPVMRNVSAVRTVVEKA